MPTNNLFQLTFPDGWRETTVYTFEGPHDSGIQHNLVVTVNPNVDKNADLAKMAKEQLLVSTQMLPGYEFISESEKKFSSGAPVFIVVYRYSPADTVTYWQKQYYTIMDDKMYIFTATFSKKTIRTIGPEVDKIIAGFRPLAVPEPKE